MEDGFSSDFRQIIKYIKQANLLRHKNINFVSCTTAFLVFYVSFPLHKIIINIETKTSHCKSSLSNSKQFKSKF